MSAVATKPKPRQITYMLLADIAPADRNPKGHATDVIKGSISRFGFIEPMVLDERTGKLVGGHGRRDDLMLREAEGESPPEGIVTDTKGRWLAPVTRGWASLSDDHAHAAGIALNRSSELGGWLDEELWPLLEELNATPEGLDGLGFTEDDLLELQAQAGELARRAGGFLDGLISEGDGSNPLGSDGAHSAMTGFGVVELRLPMSAADRDEVVLLLRQHQRTLSAESLAATLLEVVKSWRAPRK